ncbi:unnamed protein product [Didymodactylos carnosus]|uniref:Carboxylesterase type B domain-containing protein n=1 Tax=Didymodactylos carnosus TaxID=1234261 RepID=A0A814TJ37_9BILA|nr:unnamed protein product [Didymodactylos carnosus]CAF1160778.1 unnamed protein product [Didymodactylos carnosus]CAF3825747.1 unnamed protein product [Didymodactylos carnosus]CAF3924288.1 unnamed protein product [Didymodactylos carnosus]
MIGIYNSADQVYSFLGVPYAVPPVASLRWTDPQSDTSKLNHYNAKQRQSDCFQRTFPFGVESQIIGSEDCLYLNIYVPSSPPRSTAGYPVVVYLHGGGFQTTDFDPQGYNLVKFSQSMIYVHVYYRLNVFGFFALPALSAEHMPIASSGNYGLKDQQLALKWVNQNIADFNGNKQNITLEGHSAGSISVCYHLLNPESNKLFRQIILHAGACEPSLAGPNSLMDMEERGQVLVNSTNCSGLTASAQMTCLRRLSSSQLFTFAGSLAFVPNYDGLFFAQTARQLFLQGKFPLYPTLAGKAGAGEMATNLYTNTLGLPIPYTQITWTNAPLLAAAVVNAPSSLNQTIAVYYSQANYAHQSISDPLWAVSDAYSAYLIQCPTARAARFLAAGQAVVFLYTFEYVTVNLYEVYRNANATRALHGSELQFFFNQPAFFSNYIFTPAETQLSLALQHLTTRFIVHGNPNQNDTYIDQKFPASPAPVWSQYNVTQDNWLQITTARTFRTANNLLQNECQNLWDYYLQSSEIQTPVQRHTMCQTDECSTDTASTTILSKLTVFLVFVFSALAGL